MNWEAQSFQAAWFKSGPLPKAAEMLKAVTGQDATQVVSQSGVETAVFVDGSRDYRAVTRNGRIDVFLTASAASASALMGPPEPLLDEFLKMIGNVKPGPAINRIALVANVSTVAATAEEATNALVRRLGFTIPFAGSDFLFQINRRKSTPVASVDVNRLLKWHSEIINLIELAAPAPIATVTHVASLQVDVNTVPIAGKQYDEKELDTLFAYVANESKRLFVANNIAALD